MVFDTVREILAHQLELEPELITMDTDILADLGADSLDVVELVTAIEEEYDIVITDESVNTMTTVGQIVRYLESIV